MITKEELENKITVLLGGRAAEEVVFDRLSTGAADDIAKVTDIAKSMVLRFGMALDLGLRSFESEKDNYLGQHMPSTSSHSEETARKIDLEIKSIVDRCYGREKPK